MVSRWSKTQAAALTGVAAGLQMIYRTPIAAGGYNAQQFFKAAYKNRYDLGFFDGKGFGKSVGRVSYT